MERHLACAKPEHEHDGAGAHDGVEAEEEAGRPRREQAPLDNLVLRPSIPVCGRLLLCKRAHLQHATLTNSV